MEEKVLKIDSNVMELIGIADESLPGKQFKRFVQPVYNEIFIQVKIKDIEIEKIQTQLDKANEKNEALASELAVIKEQLIPNKEKRDA